MSKQAGIRKIEEFLENLTFGKTLLGANQSDVYACLKDVSAMYEDIIADMDQEQTAEVEGLKRTIAAKEQRIEELIRQTAAPQVQAKPEDARIIEGLKERLKAAVAHEEEYRAKTELLARSIEEQQHEKEERRARAEREARLIVAKAKEEADKIVEQAENRVRMEYRRTQETLKEAVRVRKNMQESLRLIASDLSSMTTEVGDLRGKVEELPDIQQQPSAISFSHELSVSRKKEDFGT